MRAEKALGSHEVSPLIEAGELLPPCGACLELMAQIMGEKSVEAEIAIDLRKGTVRKLIDLLPMRWHMKNQCGNP